MICGLHVDSGDPCLSLTKGRRRMGGLKPETLGMDNNRESQNGCFAEAGSFLPPY